MNTEMNKPKTLTAQESQDKFWDEYWYIDAKQYSKAERVIIMILKITGVLLLFPLVLCSAAALSHSEPDDDSGVAGDPSPDGINELSEDRKYELSKRGHFV